MIILKLENVEVQHVNMLSTLNLVSFPAITAFTGFGNSIAYNYGINESQVLILSEGSEVEVGYEKYGKYNTNKIKGINTFISNKSDKKMALSDQPNVFGRLNVTLYIYFEDSIKNKIRNDLMSGKFKKELLTKYRIAGGLISKIKDIKLFEDEQEVVEDIFKNNKSSYFVTDKRDVIQQRDDNENQISSMLKMTKEKDHEKGITYGMTMLGYILLEKPCQKNGSRENKKHAYAEPMIGLISFEKVRYFDKNNALPIWQLIKQDNIIVAIN